MKLPRTVVALAVAALLAIGIRAVLQTRTGNAAAPEMPPAAQPIVERPPAASPPPVDHEAQRLAVADAISSEARPAADPSAPARLTVELVAAGRPAQQGEVELRLRSESEGRSASVDPADGCARFEALPPGTYMISLSRLPPGFLAPSAYRSPGGADPERYGIALAGQDRTQRIELEAAAHVFGFVGTPDGRLARSASVQWSRTSRYSLRAAFSNRGDMRRQQVDQLGFDVIDGRYECDVVAGLWLVTIDGQIVDENGRSSGRFGTAMPQLRRLTPGTTTQIDLNFRPAGTCSLRGTILDEEGQPFGGLVVQVKDLLTLVEPSTGEQLEWSGGGAFGLSSHDDGSFQFDKLFPGRCSVSVEPEGYKPMGPAGAGKLGEPVPPREIQLVDGVATLEYTIRRPHRVHLTGRIEIDPAWAKEHGVEGLLPMMDFVCPSGREDVPETREQVPVRADGFDLWVDAGVREPRLELWLRSEHLVQPLTLSATAEPAPLTIRIPR